MNNFSTAAAQHKLDCFSIAPWASPDIASRIAGLGGANASDDPACVFQTGPMMFPAGRVSLTVTMEGYCGDFAAMLLVLFNGAAVPGSPQVRMQLSVAELKPEQDTPHTFSVNFVADDQIAYQLGGYIHGDGDARARRLSICSDREPRRLSPVLPIAPRLLSRQESEAGGGGCQQRGQLFNPAPPEFEQVYSQPSTPAQLAHPAFVRLCAELSLAPSGLDNTGSWPEIFALRALELFDRLWPSRSIGFDANGSPLCPALLRQGGTVVVADRTFNPEANVDIGERRKSATARHPDMSNAGQRFQYTLIGEALPPSYCGLFDFAWWVTRDLTDWRSVLRGALNVAESLDDKGVGIAVFPLDFTPGYQNGPGCAEADLPKIIIELLSLGHRVVQARLPGPSARITYFGLIIRR